MRCPAARSLPLLAAACCLAGGCAGSLFTSKVPPPTHYLLTVPGPAPVAANANANASPNADAGRATPGIAILRPHVRVGLDNDRIGVLYPDRRLDYFAGARWSGPLDEVIEDLAVRLFQSRAGLRNVSGDASAFASDYWLEIQVADFQAEYDRDAEMPTVRVHFLASLGTAGSRHIVARFDAEAREPAAANRLADIVEAYDRAASRALLQIAQDCAMALAAST